MKTVDKALHVLNQFSLGKTEIGLSDLARMSGLDKAATRRLLVAMSKHGFIEQVSDTRKYRLGAGFLRLARIREATVPLAQAGQEAADWLAQRANETVHVSVPGDQGMTTVAFRLPDRARVINIIPAQVLLYHATASGLAFLAFCSAATLEEKMSLPLTPMTPDTLQEKSDLLAALGQFRSQGFSQTKSSFESDVASIGMPIRCGQRDPIASIAIALPQTDLTDARCDELVPLLQDAVQRIEAALTGLSALTV